MGLLDRARKGDQRALARLCTLIEADDPSALNAVDALGDPPGEIQVLGITGPPGAGKSTLINLLLKELRSDERRIAVLLVDPSSEVTGGAVLGDRVRMLAWGDADVFVRSQANRGQTGGLAPSTATLIDLFAHLGFGTVVIETVGVGQDGIDIRALSTTSIVVQSPHLGDSVQSLKAGILEIADIFVVTKADLPGPHQVVRDLNSMIHLDQHPIDGWQAPVIAVSSTEERGVDELAAKVGAHADHRRASGSGSDRLERWRWEIVKRAETRISQASRQLSADQLGPATSRSDRVRALLEEALAGSGRPGLRSGRP
jgi:LAO/AO transport system kinase